MRPDVAGMISSQGIIAPNAQDVIIRIGTPDANGLLGVNKNLGWIAVTDQRLAGKAMGVVLSRGDKAAVTTLIDSIEWTFSQMKPDGSFVYINTSTMLESTNPLALAGANAAFLADVVPALMEMDATSSTYRKLVDPVRAQVALAVKYTYDNRAVVVRDAALYTNRQIRLAEALIASGLFLKNTTYLNEGRKILRDALALQTPEGVFPEGGGYDTSYQIVSLNYLAMSAFLDPDPAFIAALRKGVDWELTRFLSDGRIDATGNTRTAVGEVDPRLNTVKNGHNPPIVCISLAHAAGMLKSDPLQEALQAFTLIAFDGTLLAPPSDYIYVAPPAE
ncbi:MAG TPA: hypothetical protein VGE01_12195 [Fimbriimonas sp.]